jgi:diguanylate cyclase (GGDEF)-like protein
MEGSAVPLVPFLATNVLVAACVVLGAAGGSVFHLVSGLGGASLAVYLHSRAGRRREAELRGRVEEAGLALEQANIRLDEMATRDELTGVRNRSYFFQQIDLECRRAAGAHEPLSIVVLDIDGLKALNDAYGPAEGDSALARVAACIRAASRRTTDCVARIGGEEFAVLLPGTKGEGAATFAERVRHDIEALQIPHVRSAVGPVLTVSLGVSCVRPRNGNDTARLVAAADRALYRSKAGGRNRVSFEECGTAALSAAAPA